jgi:hypothetical protein
MIRLALIDLSGTPHNCEIAFDDAVDAISRL